jgi:DNA invertase Pin-like site-specific DNA recombinase
MNVVIYGRVSTQDQDFQRQIFNLKKIAEEKNWKVRRTFQEKISGTVKSDNRPEFKSMLHYIEKNKIDICMVSEVSRIGRTVLNVLSSVDQIHQMGTGFYIQQFNIITFQNGKEDPIAKMLLQMLSIGSEMENSMRRERQLEGIQMAKINGKYTGRKKGAKADAGLQLKKYKDVVDLLCNSDLSLRRIAQITNHSVNTVRKVRIITDN